MKACYELQNVLFRETLYAFRRVSKAIHELGDWEAEYSESHAQFHALYTVVENALLEEVYQRWKKKVFARLTEDGFAVTNGQQLKDIPWELIARAIDELNDEADGGESDE